MFFRMVYKSGQIFLPFCHNARVWRTDGQTDRILIARPRLHCMQRGKNRVTRAFKCTYAQKRNLREAATKFEVNFDLSTRDYETAALLGVVTVLSRHRSASQSDAPRKQCPHFRWDAVTADVSPLSEMPWYSVAHLRRAGRGHDPPSRRVLKHHIRFLG